MIKNRKSYKSIGEVAKEISTNTHTLRFWEKEFKQIKPLTLTGNRRYYSQKDINILEAKKILKNKIIGITCHNSIKLARNALLNGADYIALGAFYKTKTKKVIHKADVKILKKIKKSINLPIVAIGGVNEKNYKKLLLNKADFLAISGYIWNNKKFKPHQAIKNLI